MKWIDVQQKLPEDGELVFVVIQFYDPDEGPLCQKVNSCISQGKFFRSEGWKVVFNPLNKVTHWTKTLWPKGVREK